MNKLDYRGIFNEEVKVETFNMENGFTVEVHFKFMEDWGDWSDEITIGFIGKTIKSALEVAYPVIEELLTKGYPYHRFEGEE